MDIELLWLLKNLKSKYKQNIECTAIEWFDDKLTTCNIYI